jgi:hypothetical protein
MTILHLKDGQDSMTDEIACLMTGSHSTGLRVHYSMKECHISGLSFTHIGACGLHLG